MSNKRRNELKNLKILSIVVALCLATLFVGCSKETIKITPTEASNENTPVESVSTLTEASETSLSDSSEESLQTVSANEIADISSSEEDEQTEFLYTFDGDYTTILDGIYDLIVNWDGQNYLYNPYGSTGLDEFIF